MKKPRTLNELRNDPRVRDVLDERGYGNGIFVHLANGWCDPEYDPVGWPDCSTIREDTVKEVLARFKYVNRNRL